MDYARHQLLVDGEPDGGAHLGGREWDGEEGVTRGLEWTKFMVPSIGSMIQVGAEV